MPVTAFSSSAGRWSNRCTVLAPALREHVDAVIEAGVPIYASGMSSKARGLVADDVPFPVEMATPARLVQLTFESDRVLTY